MDKSVSNAKSSVPLISIALATYNGKRYLQPLLDSLLAQDYPNIEIVISDDCSDDGTWRILEACAASHDSVILLPRTENVGHVKNFIRSFRACTGELIAPADQDDIWHPAKLTRLARAIGSSEIAYCNSRYMDKDGVPLQRTMSDKRQMVSGSDSRSLLFSSCVAAHAMLFKKPLLSICRLPEDIPFVDWLLAFIAMEYGSITYVDEVLVDWRQHESSVTAASKWDSQACRRRRLELNEKMLYAILAVAGRNKEFVKTALQSWITWKRSYFSLSMYLYVRRNGRVTHITHPARFPSLKYLVGHKLKALSRPKYY